MEHLNHIRLGGGSITPSGGAAVKTGVALLGLPVLWALAYLGGLAPWLGFEHRSVQNIGVGPLTHAGGSGGGLAIGLEKFLFLEGQEVFVDYDVEVQRGSLVVRVFDYSRFEHILHTHIAQSGAGRVTVRIPRTGLYKVAIEPSAVRGPGEGFDLTYDATWGARW